MKLINYTEILVKQQLDKLLDHSNGCKCEQCKMDILALALNKLPPRYVVSDKGQVFSKINCFNTQTNVDVLGALSDAIEKVNQKPNH